MGQRPQLYRRQQALLLSSKLSRACAIADIGIASLRGEQRVGAMPADAVTDMVQDAVRANADASLLNLAAKAHGNPFLVSELVCGLAEERRLTVSDGCAVATGHGLPRRLGTGMRQRLDLLSDSASEVGRVANEPPGGSRDFDVSESPDNPGRFMIRRPPRHHHDFPTTARVS